MSGETEIILFFIETSLNKERTTNENDLDPVPCNPWTHKASKTVQPNLDYIGKIFTPFYPLDASSSSIEFKYPLVYSWYIFIAPEIQLRKICSIRSDMYSLGMVIAAIYNDGKSLIQANHSTSEYIKQAENVSLILL